MPAAATSSLSSPPSRAASPRPAQSADLQEQALHAGLLGAKYERGGSQLLASSSDRGWNAGLAAELRRHSELHCPAFVQPVNEVAISMQGSARMQRRGQGPEQKFIARPGAACLCPQGVNVRYLHIEAGTLDILHLYLPADLFGLLEVAPHSERDLGLHYLAGLHDPLVTQIGLAIADELAKPLSSRAGSLLIESLGVALAARLAERYARPGPVRQAQREMPAHVRGGLDPRRLQRVLDYIEAHAEVPIGLEALAREACLSRFHFARAFHQSMGQTPLAYVNAVRVNRAKRLLREDGGSIEAIAATLQFSSGSNFVRTFKRAVGLTPGDYRAMH